MAIAYGHASNVHDMMREKSHSNPWKVKARNHDGMDVAHIERSR